MEHEGMNTSVFLILVLTERQHLLLVVCPRPLFNSCASVAWQPFSPLFVSYKPFCTYPVFFLISPFLCSFLPHRCLQNYIPPQSLTLSCPVCRQTSILPEKGVAALQNNFFITNLMEVLQRDPECSRPEACNVLESVSAAVAGKPLSCPNHEGKVCFLLIRNKYEKTCRKLSN